MAIKGSFFPRNPGKNLYSIENLFKNIRTCLPPIIQPTVIISRFVNSGVFHKVYNIFEVFSKPQGDVNHVTGDVHYLTFFLKKKKTILTIHDVNLMYTSNRFKRGVHQLLWLRIPAKRSAVLTVISQTTKEELLKYVPCQPGKIRVIHNCISGQFKPAPRPFNKQKPVLLHIGVKPNKNLDRVARAIAGIECRLQIIGRPPAHTIELLDALHIDYAWQSHLSEEEVIRQYVECDMLLFVSTFEGFGLPIIEANTIERPVVTGNVSAMPEIAGRAACLVDPFDVDSIRSGILRVITDDGYREQLLAEGRINRERFKPERIARQYSELYEEVYNGSDRR